MFLETSFTTQNVLSETYGNGSKCFNHNNQWTLRGNSISLFGAGCYLVMTSIHSSIHPIICSQRE